MPPRAHSEHLLWLPDLSDRANLMMFSSSVVRPTGSDYSAPINLFQLDQAAQAVEALTGLRP